MARYRVQAGDRIVHRGADHHEAQDLYLAAVADSTGEEVTLFCDGNVSERFQPKARKRPGLVLRIWHRLVHGVPRMEEETCDKP